MGGCGSGRQSGWSADKCEDYRSIDFAWLKRQGILDRTSWSNINWSQGGEKVASIQVRAEPGGLRLSYRTRNPGEEWQDVDEVIPFSYTPTRFGGQRRWFQCLSCGRNCRVIYGGGLYRCRKCCNLKYESQYEPCWIRVASKAQKIRERLGGSTVLDDCFPEKPLNMQWKTYERLKKQDEMLLERWAVISMEWMHKCGR